MSDHEGEWPDETGRYADETDAYAPVVSRSILPSILGWLLALIAIGWIALSVWYINRVLGWQTIPDLLPHEIGGILAGMLAPPAVLFAMAAWTVRDQQMSYDVAVLEQQIWRMENPHRRAQAGLTEVGHGLLSYAASLRELIDAMRGQIEAIEANFQDVVENTVGRVAGAGESASQDIRVAADLVIARTQEVVDRVQQQTVAAQNALGETGVQIARDVTAASEVALTNARTIGEELGQHANQVGMGFEQAVARASDRLEELSREASDRADALARELAERIDGTGTSFAQVADTVAGRVQQVSEDAAQRAREIAEAASASIAQTS